MRTVILYAIIILTYLMLATAVRAEEVRLYNGWEEVAVITWSQTEPVHIEYIDEEMGPGLVADFLNWCEENSPEREQGAEF